MRVLTLNANGVRSALAKGLAEQLHELAPDAVCLQEVRAADALVPHLPPWPTRYWHAAERRGYSGVATLLPRPAASCQVGIIATEFDAEGRVLVTELDSSYGGELGRVELINVYVPSGTSGEVRQSVKMRFLDSLLALVRAKLSQAARAGDREVLVCVDLNIAHTKRDLRNWRSNQRNSGFLPEERAWFDALLAAGTVDVVRRLAGPDADVYSWWSLRSGARARDVGWRLDYQLATPRLAERALAYGIPRSPAVSDHAPVWVDYDVGRNPAVT